MRCTDLWPIDVANIELLYRLHFAHVVALQNQKLIAPVGQSCHIPEGKRTENTQACLQDYQIVDPGLHDVAFYIFFYMCTNADTQEMIYMIRPSVAREGAYLRTWPKVDFFPLENIETILNYFEDDPRVFEAQTIHQGDNEVRFWVHP